jgi:transcriptional regulator with XRE-family HTH domain
MVTAAIDMERVRSALRDAVKPIGSFSQRGLAREAGLDRDAVYDILQGRNKNPSLRVLAALARAIGSDLTAFGIEMRSEAPNAAELELAILESLPAMPRRGSWERKASFLAESVAAALGLPPGPAATQPAADHPLASELAKDAALRAPTN